VAVGMLRMVHVHTDVLIIDDDLGFVFWLGHALDQAGCRAFPARNVNDALALASELDIEPGLVITGGSQPGAENLVARWRTRHKDLRVIWLLEEGHEPGLRRHGADDGQCRKPSRRNVEDSAELLLAIDRVLARETVNAAGR
jgi:hypothetical protein